ncbi:hypothetical protein QYF50_18690 [Paenibacillus vini]|uniref:phage tail protein n=1 Tax=Paenibacillus vini TaxID=1476024 RepID=UPI0025B6E255|nr:hypothetical protein [Paenibacillus vini]MDN4069933.1 hypothetical protein [Paenibacillus vini]
MAVVKNLMVRAGADFSGLRQEMKKSMKDVSAFKTRTSKELNDFKKDVSKMIKNIKVEVPRKEMDSFKRKIQESNKEMGRFGTGVSKALKGIAIAIASIGIGAAIKSATNDAMQFEAAIAQLNRTMGSSAGAFREWAKDNASAFGMSQLEITKYGAVYSNLLSAFTSGTAETTQKTQDLLKASAIVAAATGRTMEDTMERIRSGLLGNTEAIEDLGINVNIAMIESTNAFKQFANGKHWNQLSFQTQQQIRLMAILEQAQTKYGDQIANTTISRQNQLVAQLKNVKLALGQAFLPVYNAVLPALIRFATALATVMNYIAQFTTALFGGTAKAQNEQSKATNAQAGAVSGLGDAYKAAGDKAKKAGKKAKGAAASFDQLNLVGGTDSKDKDSKEDPVDMGGGAIDGGMLGGLNDGLIDVSDKAQAMADKVRTSLTQAFSKVKDAWKFTTSLFAPSFKQAWNEISPVLENWKTLFGKVFSDIQLLGEPLKNWVITGLLPNWQRGIELAGHVVAGLYDSVHKVFSSLWEAIYPIIDKLVTDGLPRISEFINEAIDIFRQLFDLVKKIFDDIWMGAVDPAMKLISKIITDVLDIIFKWWDDWGKKIVDGIKVALDKIRELWDSLWNKFLKPFITNMLEMLTWLWDKHLKGLVDEIMTFVGKVVTAGLDIYNKFIMPLITWLVDKLGPTFSNIFSLVGDVIGTALGVISDVAKGIIKALGGIVDFIAGAFTGDWKKAWEGIKTFFQGLGDSLVGIFKGAVNLIIDALNFMIRQINKVKIDVPEWVGKIPGVPDDIGSIGFSIPTIPKLAKGGLAFGPTLAVVGDNKGASSNPEVIAPLDTLMGYMDQSGGDNRETVSVLNAILRAVQSGQNVNVQISQKAIGQAAIQEIKNETRRTGAVPFPV